MKIKKKKLKKYQKYNLEFLIKTNLVTKTLKTNNILKLNLKLNLLKNLLLNLNFKTSLILLKKNYYNLININNFFEKLTLTLKKKKKKKKKNKRVIKLNLTGLKFQKNYFLFFFFFFFF